MTIDELETSLGKETNCVIDDISDTNWILVWNASDKTLLARINKYERFKLEVYKRVSHTNFSRGLLHFAATPIEKRVSDASGDLWLSKAEIQSIANLDVSEIFNNSKTFDVSRLQFTVLKKILRQVNRDGWQMF